MSKLSFVESEYLRAINVSGQKNLKYEGSAPVALKEWIKMRIEVNGETAEMFINDMKYSSFTVNKMLGKHKLGGVGLYVDIGTIGYFKDLKVTMGPLKKKSTDDKVDDI